MANVKCEAILAEDKTRMMYYINDGVYGLFNCILYDHADVNVEYLKVCSKLHAIICSIILIFQAIGKNMRWPGLYPSTVSDPHARCG